MVSIRWYMLCRTGYSWGLLAQKLDEADLDVPYVTVQFRLPDGTLHALWTSIRHRTGLFISFREDPTDER